MRDKIGDYEDWKDGHDAFRANTATFAKETTKMLEFLHNQVESLHNRVNELELIIEERNNIERHTRQDS
tara:strand:- start:297 stop:503 length:207 start_codon:yes stop_codon:yes gene_type:complete